MQANAATATAIMIRRMVDRNRGTVRGSCGLAMGHGSDSGCLLPGAPDRRILAWRDPRRAGFVELAVAVVDLKRHRRQGRAVDSASPGVVGAFAVRRRPAPGL